MLILKCGACRRKLWRYDKIGSGEVLVCYSERITRVFQFQEREGRVFCQCGREIGRREGDGIRMNRLAFTYAGTKRTS